MKSSRARKIPTTAICRKKQTNTRQFLNQELIKVILISNFKGYICVSSDITIEKVIF